MPYGTIKVDTITFTSGSSDVSVAISGLIQNPTFTGNVTVTGTVSGDVIRGQTVSGATVTGTAGQFGTLTGNTAGFTTVTGTTVTGTTANFATVSGTTVTGATARFTTTTGVSGVFTSQLSGATVTGDTFQGSNITGVSGVFTTRVSGATVTGNAIVGSTITGVSGVFTTVISGASGVIAGNITASAFIPTGSAVPTNGVYLPSANTVGIAANSSGILFATSSGVGIGNSLPSGSLHIGPAFVSGGDAATLNLKQTNTTATGGIYIERPTEQKGYYIYINPTIQDGLTFRSNADGTKTDRVTFQRDGTVLVGVTSANANGGVLQLKSGITFPGTQVPSSDANTLDDYEEGLYTPAITCGSSGTITLSTSVDTLSYTKVGRVVFLQGRVLIASKSSPVGSFNVSLPFATQQNTGDNSYYQGIQVLTHDFDLSAGALVTFLEASTASVTAAPMYQTVDNSGWIQFPAANIKGNAQEYFYINGYYFTDA